jgi:hypothetical protein
MTVLLIEGTFSLRVVQEPVIRTIITVDYDGWILTLEGNHMAYTLPNDKMINVQVTYVDAKGNPATVDSVAWASSNVAILAVTEDTTDSTKASVVPVGAVGQAQITATADVDLGAGVKNLITTMDIAVVAGEAVAGTIAPVGDPQPIT